MGQRLELQTILEGILPNGKVYFQPPENITLTYPCIVYSRDMADTRHADNVGYTITQRYQVTFISRDPDASGREKIAGLPMCLYERFYTADNLNHDVYTLYF